MDNRLRPLAIVGVALGLFGVSSFSAVAGPVSGTITTDTTWDSGTYDLYGLVSVSPGATLTIAPGVIVSGATFDAQLVVVGRLVAVGTTESPILFTAPGATRGAWRGIELSDGSTSAISYCVIEKASEALKFEGFNVTPVVRDVIFRNNFTAITADQGYKPWVIENNTFQRNGGALRGLRTLGDTFIRFNHFDDNLSVMEYGFYFGNVQISNNNFVRNDFVFRAPEIGYGYGTVAMPDNWWDGTDTSVVDGLIFDGNDDARLQIVNYQPIATDLIANAGSRFSPEPVGLLQSLTLRTAEVAGCKSLTAEVGLSKAAPLEGVLITLSDTLVSASTSATLKIPSGATTKKFTIKTTPVSVEETGTVSATLGVTALSQNLTVRPMGMLSVALSPTTVVGSNTVTGTAKLECKAGPGPITVDLLSSKPEVANPVAAGIVVPQGVQSAPFDITTSPVLSKTTASISGTANAITKSKTLTVTLAASVSPTSLKLGSVPIGQTSAPLTATLTNKGAISFAVNSISLTGTAASWFAQTNNCPASLAAGASCSVSVTFTPLSAASKSAKLSVATSATATPLSVSLSGTGVLPP